MKRFLLTFFCLLPGCAYCLTGSNLVPQMVSANSPSPFVISASTTWSSSYSWKAFDRNGGTPYESDNGGYPTYIQVDRGTNDNFFITGINVRAENPGPSNFYMQTSSDLTNWTTFLPGTMVNNQNTQTFSCTEQPMYRYTRFVASNGWSASGWALFDLEIWGYQYYSGGGGASTNGTTTNSLGYYDAAIWTNTSLIQTQTLLVPAIYSNVSLIQTQTMLIPGIFSNTAFDAGIYTQAMNLISMLSSNSSYFTNVFNMFSQAMTNFAKTTITNALVVGARTNGMSGLTAGEQWVADTHGGIINSLGNVKAPMSPGSQYESSASLMRKVMEALYDGKDVNDKTICDHLQQLDRYQEYGTSAAHVWIANDESTPVTVQGKVSIDGAAIVISNSQNISVGEISQRMGETWNVHDQQLQYSLESGLTNVINSLGNVQIASNFVMREAESNWYDYANVTQSEYNAKIVVDEFSNSLSQVTTNFLSLQTSTNFIANLMKIQFPTLGKTSYINMSLPVTKSLLGSGSDDDFQIDLSKATFLPLLRQLETWILYITFMFIIFKVIREGIA